MDTLVLARCSVILSKHKYLRQLIIRTELFKKKFSIIEQSFTIYVCA